MGSLLLLYFPAKTILHKTTCDEYRHLERLSIQLEISPALLIFLF